MQSHILSIILFTPLVGTLLILVIPGEKKNAIRWVANIFALGGFLISLPLVPWFWAQRMEPGFKFIRARPTTGSHRLARVTCWALTAFRSC